MADGAVKTAVCWFEMTPMEPPVLKSSMLTMFPALAETENCSGAKIGAFVPVSRAEKVALSGVFWNCASRDTAVWVRTLVPS